MSGSRVAPEPARRDLDWRLVLLVVWIVGAVYVRWRLGNDWIPHDDGALAQSAERLNQGQLPHRDFDEVYTGGLTWVNAIAFRLFGTNLWTLRLVLFGVFVAWIPAVFYVASRLTRPAVAGSMTLLAVVWSVPNYPAAMPSWYNLFLATFGIAALFRYLEDGRRSWLVAAGVAGGLSFLVKVVGLYYVAGVLLFLVFHAHVASRATVGADQRRGVGYPTFVSLALLVFVAALFSVVRRQLGAGELVQFVLPGVLIAGLLVRNEWKQSAGDDRARFATLLRLIVPFAAGVALPIAIFLVPYLRSGSLGAFVNGVFVLPMRRFGFASAPALPLPTMLSVLPIVFLGWWLYRVKGILRRGERIAIGAALAFLLAMTARNEVAYRGVWYAARGLFPVLAVIGVVSLSREREADTRSPRLRQQALLLLSVTAVCSLVQFPFAVSNYFFYLAPLVALTALALYRCLPPISGAVPGLLVAFFATFALLRTNSRPLMSIGVRHEALYPLKTLTLDRGGIRIPQLHAATYEALVPALRARARGGYTWAAPDSPEIYFLSGLKNPTRTLYDFFADSSNGEDSVLRTLDAHGVTAVVINSVPSFSPQISRGMFAQLATRYPRGQSIGPFLLLWRE